jgi:hypothetical protein
MPTNLPIRDRVKELEREVRDLRRVLESERGRPAQLAHPRHVRLGKTTSSSTYPSGGNTFEFVFVELSFTRTAGSQTQTFTDRSGAPQGVGQSASGQYIPEDTRVWVLEQANGQYLLADAGGLPVLLGELDDDLDAGSSATLNIWGGTPNSESDSGATVTVYDWLLGSGEKVSAGQKVVAAWINNAWYVIAAECE